MAGNRYALTQELYENALEAFRAHPGQIGSVAKLLGLDSRTVRRMWEGPKYKAYPWLHIIKHVLDQENAERLKVRRAEERRRMDLEAEARAAKRRELAESKELDGKMLKAARGNAAALLQTAASLHPAVVALAKTINKAMHPDDGKAPQIPIVQAMNLLNTYSRITQRAAMVGAALLELSRLERGEPTSIVGIAPAPELNYEEALAEIEESKRLIEAVEHFRALGETEH